MQLNNNNICFKYFSEFSRHISPAFNHERPERSVQMRLYTMHKGQHLLIFIMFLCLFLIALLMGMAGPRILAQHSEKATELKNPQQNNKTGNPIIDYTSQCTNYGKYLQIILHCINV